MNEDKSMTFVSRKKSFDYAFNGLAQLWKEPNSKIHFVATVVVVAAGVFFGLSPIRWIALFFAIGLVWITEALNTCIERLCDFSCDNQFHPLIKIIKDIGAAAVLIAAVVSIGIGIFVFCF